MLSRQLLTVQEDERRGIARELHDEVGHTLTAVRTHNEVMLRTSPPEAPCARLTRECIGIVEQIQRQVRDLGLVLRPPQLDDLGLVRRRAGSSTGSVTSPVWRHNSRPAGSAAASTRSGPPFASG